MTALLHILTAALLLAWLCTAVAWAAAGVAVASWGRLPLWLGALLGAALPLFGVLVLTTLALRRRRVRLPGMALAGTDPPRLTGPGYLPSTAVNSSLSSAQFGSAPSSQMGLATPAGFADPAAHELADPLGLTSPASPFGLNGPAAPFGLSSPASPFGQATTPFGQPTTPLASPPAAPLSTASGWRRLVRSRRALYAALALAISLALLLTLLVGDWVQVGVSDSLSVQLSAWDIGLGEMVVVSVIEFALFAAVIWRWRTRWLGVLAVFAGTWWFLLWSVSSLVGGGMRELTKDTKAVRELHSAHLAAGPIWTVLLVLAVLMIGWGIAQLAQEHLDSAGHR